MTRLKQKLHSTRGASMLLGLLFLLVCLTVGAVVLTAASVSAGHIKRTRQEQQDYLAVSSAARLVEEDIKAAEFIGAYDQVTKEWFEFVDTGRLDDKGESIKERNDYSEIFYREGPSSLNGSKLLADIEHDLTALYFTEKYSVGSPWVAQHYSTPGNMSYTLEFQADAEHDLPAVTGTLKIDSAYTILVSLQTEDGTNGLTLHFSVNSHEAPETSVEGENPKFTTTTYTTTVTWNAPTITKGAGR